MCCTLIAQFCAAFVGSNAVLNTVFVSRWFEHSVGNIMFETQSSDTVFGHADEKDWLNFKEHFMEAKSASLT